MSLYKTHKVPKKLRKLKLANVELAFSRANSIGALRHLHPRRLRNAIINGQVPEGVFKQKSNAAEVGEST